mgnify:CR=1 FL=1
MPEVENALVNILKADSAVAALVVTRVFFADAPQTPPVPFILMTRVGTQFVHSLNSNAGLSRARIQLDCYAKTQKEARSVGQAVKDAIDTFRGTNSDVIIQGVLLLDSMDGYDESPELRRVTQDYHVWYNE